MQKASRLFKIFLASSNELEHDRDIFGNFVRRLNDIYQERNTTIKLFEWEDCEASYNGCGKQDEYDVEARASDMFIALFFKKAGKYTIHEFEVACQEYNRTKIKPKVFVYCRQVAEEEKSKELLQFQKKLDKDLHYFWITYDSKDSLCFHFVMQFLLVENNNLDDVKVVDGNITLFGTRLMGMSGLSFVAGNAQYQELSQQLSEINSQIEKLRPQAVENPSNEELQNELQRLIRLRFDLEKKRENQQVYLLETAKKFASLQRESINERTRRAMEAFENGEVNKARLILNETESETRRDLDGYREIEKEYDRLGSVVQEAKSIIGALKRAGRKARETQRHLTEIKEKKRFCLLEAIDELLLKASIVMADDSQSIDERICTVIDLYAQADEAAKAIDYEKEKYADLLYKYGSFLCKYGRYDESLIILFREVTIIEELYGNDSPQAATSYHIISVVYTEMCEYHHALEYSKKAIAIRESVLGKNHSYTGASYNQAGLAFFRLKDYPNALQYYDKARKISLDLFGEYYQSSAASYLNLGSVYHDMGFYSSALEYYGKALAISLVLFGENHLQTATAYNNMGSTYDALKEFPQAVFYYKKALAIREQNLGLFHKDTVDSCENLGNSYLSMKDNPNAIFYLKKVLAVKEQGYRVGTFFIDVLYNKLGAACQEMGDYPTALEYNLKALRITLQIKGENHLDTAIMYNNFGATYHDMKDYPHALESYKKAFEISERVNGADDGFTKFLKGKIDLVKGMI